MMRRPSSKQQQHFSQKPKQQRRQPPGDILSNKYHLNSNKTSTANKAQPPMSPQTPISRPTTSNLHTTPQAIPGQHGNNPPLYARPRAETIRCNNNGPVNNEMVTPTALAPANSATASSSSRVSRPTSDTAQDVKGNTTIEPARFLTARRGVNTATATTTHHN